GREGEESGVTCVPTFAGERVAIEQGGGGGFGGIRLGSGREDFLRALVEALAQRSAGDYARLCGIHRAARDVFSMGAAGMLSDLMHRTWKGKHRFRRLEAESLAGLGRMAARVVGS
ncbi:MAG TPA: hypothetical protein VHM90_08625, partial [Phycisphaerae bacterium]|nr:hypothetical protein [Phycisphaerae bacterium]